MRPSVKSRALQALRRADERVADETNLLDRSSGQLDWYPIRPGTVHGIIGPVRVRDDGNGHLRSERNVAVADISYATGAIEIEPTFRVVYGARLKLSYFFESDKNPGIQHYEMQLVTVPIVARGRRLNARYVKARSTRNTAKRL